MGFSSIEQKREYQRKWVAARRNDFFKDKSCVKCGSTERLELDHIDRATKVSNSIWSWSEPRRLKEIEKCQVLCYDHHLEKTITETTVGHGGGWGGIRGCKCDLCLSRKRESNAEWMRKYRQGA